jgi:phage major head subunit gpT-like protein
VLKHVLLKNRYAAALGLVFVVSIQAQSPLVERVDTTAFIQVEAKSFNALTPQQQALAYWLNQSSIAIDPIIYDQLS